MYMFIPVCVCVFCSCIYSLGPRLMHMYVPDKYQALGTTKHSPCLKKNPKGNYSSQG
jgi:hypothetical protein